MNPEAYPIAVAVTPPGSKFVYRAWALDAPDVAFETNEGETAAIRGAQRALSIQMRAPEIRTVAIALPQKDATSRAFRHAYAIERVGGGYRAYCLDDLAVDAVDAELADALAAARDRVDTLDEPLRIAVGWVWGGGAQTLESQEVRVLRSPESARYVATDVLVEMMLAGLALRESLATGAYDADAAAARAKSLRERDRAALLDYLDLTWESFRDVRAEWLREHGAAYGVREA